MTLPSALLLLASSVVACSSSTPPAQHASPPPQREWRSPVHDLPKCTSNADCAADQICRTRIAAACETCDGGPALQVCDAPDACADDTNCTAPQTCQDGGCR